MSDDYELRVCLEAIQHAHEVSDVLVVERRVHFVEKTEGAGLGEKNSEQQRECHQSLFAAGQKVNSLGALSARRSVDLDVAFKRTLRVLETQIAFAAAEQRHEDIAKVLPYLDEGLQEQLSRRGVDLANRLLQRVLRRVEIVSLGREEQQALCLLVVLLDCERVHRSKCVQLLAHQLGFRPERVVVKLERLRSGE